MKEILKQVIHGKPQVHIGKAGITEAVKDQIKRQFKKKKILKVKFLTLDPFDDIKKASLKLANDTNSSVLDTRGKTCILLKNLKK